MGLRDRTIIELFYATGIRRTEMTELDPGDYDPDTQTLLIRHGKNDKSRLLPVGDRAAWWLNRFLAEARPLFNHLPNETALFLSGYGTRITPAFLGTWVAGQMKKAGITKPGACHLLRHSCATSMHLGGADIRYVQEMLGHARLETTQIYTHVNIKALSDVHARTHPHALLPRDQEHGYRDHEPPAPPEPPEPPTDNPPNPGTPPDISGGGPANPSGPEDSPCGGSGEVLGVPPAMRVAIFHTCPMPLAVQIPPGLDGNSPESERISRPGCPTQTPPDISSNCLNTNGMNAKNQPAKSVHVAYYGYRWLDPLTGRWPSRDPFEEEGGVNLHAGCSNDFVNLIDDLGNQVWAFSGIRAHFLQTNRNYVRDELSRASNGKIKPVNTKNTKPNSELHNDPSASDLAFLPGLLPLAETQLDEEAKRKAAESVKEGEFCKSCSNRKTSIAMVMVAPKRHPQDLPTTECCNLA